MLAREKWQIATLQVLELVFEERKRQEARYGHVNDQLAGGNGPETRWLLPYTTASAEEIELALRRDYEEFEEETGLPTWVHLIREELAEVVKEDDPDKLEEEVLQVAALCVSWVERQRAQRAKPRVGRGSCPRPGCEGDARYAPPGRGHSEGCTYLLPPS